jgi:hypothetical protein
MSAVLKFAQGGYRFVSGVFQYSAGAAAEPGYEIVRARFAKLVPMMEGFSRIEKYLAGLGRPVHAFCACELRSPHPFDERVSSRSTRATSSRCSAGASSRTVSIRSRGAMFALP